MSKEVGISEVTDLSEMLQQPQFKRRAFNELTNDEKFMMASLEVLFCIRMLLLEYKMQPHVFVEDVIQEMERSEYTKGCLSFLGKDGVIKAILYSHYSRHISTSQFENQPMGIVWREHPIDLNNR